MKMEAAGAGRDPSQPVQVAKMAYCDAHTPAHILQVLNNKYSYTDYFITWENWLTHLVILGKKSTRIRGEK